MKIKNKKAIAIALFALASYTASAQNKTGLHILKSHIINSPGGWDYVTVDAPNQKIYVSHGTQVNILSTATGDSIGVIPNTNGVHGIALVPALNKGYTSNGRDNTCSAFDLKTNALIATIPVGTNPDAIFYDDFSKKVYAFNGRSSDASVIDPATDKVLATVPLGGKPETGVSDGKGKIFVNSETTNEVIAIDAATYKVIARYKITDGDEPSGLAIDRATNRLFVGCGGNQTLVVIDAGNGKNLAKFHIGDCDGVAFDPELKLAYTSNNEGTISVIKEINANKFAFVENINTEKGARTIGIDVLTHHLFLPTAKLEAVAPTATNANPRPKMVPGTFHVIEVGK
ncbi:YncE family protein [Mucilaginibacter psychrotolerans]|uniref:YncE family protein n=1 Tax=Mucilaginibacter psychrotolerans TaxID=1524096 RepID=A0A4Y8SJP7_9SPHI|nr:YncE family protein [Mucilaginibacter psychrotolerans]TFF38891.1 YncE family protein [Mucilaginibacter psychrotolerans]